MTAKVRLPRKRFFKLRGNEVELAVGLLIAAVIDSQAANATVTRDGLDGASVKPDAGAPTLGQQQTLEQMLGIAPDAVKTISLEELKAHLTPEMLAKLGLDANFLDLLDHDRLAAIRQLESAFRKKIAALASEGGHKLLAQGDDHGAHADHDQESYVGFLGGEISPLLILAGVAAVAGGVILATTSDGGKNDAPVAAADTFTTAEDAPVTFDVRTNDTDANKDSLTVTAINGTAITSTAPVSITGGVVSLGADGRLTFTPTANFNGAPTFTYTVSDGRGGTSTATVTGTVTAVNDAPVAVNDTFTTAEDAPVTFDVRTNDSDVDGDARTVTAINGTAITTTNPVAVTGGVVSLGADGRLTFTPTANFNGTPSFNYTTSDGKGGTATATVNGTVTPVNDAPVNTVPGAVSGSSGTAVAITGLSVSDVDGGTGTFTTKLTIDSGALNALLVTGGATITGAGTGSITLTGTLAQINATLATVSYTGAVGTHPLQVVTTDPSGATDTDTLSVTLSTVVAGIAQDGYLAGSTVFIDANGNGVLDAGEPSTTTNGNGAFAFAGGVSVNGPIVVMGGINTDTGLPNTVVLKAPLGSSVVNPLTTLVSQIMASDPTATLESAKASVSLALGLPANVDVTTFDFLSPSNDPAISLQVQKSAVQIAAVLAIASSAGGTPAEQAAVQSAVLAKLIAAVTTGQHVDLTNLSTIHDLLTGTGLSDTQVTSASLQTAAVNQAVQQAENPADLAESVKELLPEGSQLPPVVTTDHIETTSSVPVTINLLANDVDPEGGNLTITKIGNIPVTRGTVVNVEGGTVTVGDAGEITFTPNPGFSGTPTFEYEVTDPAGHTAVGTVELNITTPTTGPADVLEITQDNVGFVAEHAQDYVAQGITTLDVIGDTLTINGTQAGLLVDAGLHFADSDNVTLEPTGAEGTHLSTTLKGLSDLNVTTVRIQGTELVIDAGMALGDISASSLPVFVGETGDPSVTVNIEAGTLDANFDAGSIASALHSAGVDHLNVVDGSLELSETQALALVNAGLDIVAAADVELNVSEGGVHALAANGSLISEASIDHLDVIGDQVTLTDDEAGSLVNAGVDFVDGDNVTVDAEHTQLNTSLKGLQSLNIDVVRQHFGDALIVDAGSTLDGISTADLPHFGDIGTDPNTIDVTLTVDGGTLDSSTDLSSLAGDLHTAGVDHIAVDGALSLDVAQLAQLGAAGLDFADGSDVTLRFGLTDDFDLAQVVAQGVTHLDFQGDTVEISDSDAANAIALGVDFVESDNVVVHSDGTHLSSSLSDLQALHVDTINVDGSTELHLNAGDLTALTTTDLPQFDVTQTDASLEVTLRVNPAQLDELDRLGAALREAGVDHFGLDQPLDTYDQATLDRMEAISTASGIDFVYDPEPDSGVAISSFIQEPAGEADQGLVQSIIAAFDEAHDHGIGGAVTVQDDVIPALAESGALRAYTADTLVVDGTHSGDQLLTTLKDIADLGVDKVQLAGGSGPAFIDIGSFSGDEVSEIKKLFETLDQNVPTGGIFEGNDHVALVVDESVAHALAQVEGGMEKLAAMGFTQLDVLMESGSTVAPIESNAVEVKLIGQDDDLYKHLHHD
jgi:hypothetical protein